MKITVLFFAHIKEHTATDRLVLELPAGDTVHALKSELLRRYPALRNPFANVITSVDKEFARDDLVLTDGAEVGFFPPVSGGTEQKDIVQLINGPISVDDIVTRLTDDSTGGMCLFPGIVRRNTGREENRVTQKLFYESYPEMAEQKMHEIVREIKSRWPLVERVAIIQRLGELFPGDVSTLIACSSSHRDSGIFEAARYAIDRLKEIVPVWKKEFTNNGDFWVEGEYNPLSSE